MKKPLKMTCIILSAILIFAAAVAMIIHLFAEGALRMGIETAATKALNVGVSIEDVDLSILGGRVDFQNLSINNPSGYQYERLLELRAATIKVGMKSLLSDVVNIREIKLDGVDVVLEQRDISGNNLQDIIKSMSSQAKTTDEPKSSGKKLHIDNLEISNITVKVKLLPVPGKLDTVELKLSPIKMTNLGGDNKLDAAKLSGKILLAIASGVAEQGVGRLPEDIVGGLRTELGKLGELSGILLDEGGKVLKEGADLGKDIVEGGKDIGKAVTEGLGGLLKPKKNEE